MSSSENGRPIIEMTGRAREALLAHVGGEGKARYLRIHVGRG